jgi:hypothetical protein
MEDENGWERLEKHLLVRLARAGSADLHGLGLGDVCKSVFNGVYRIGLREGLKVSYQDKFAGGRERKEMEWTWMWSLSDRQASIVTLSGWFGARTVERDLPPNMHEMGESTELAYPCPSIHRNVRASGRQKRQDTESERIIGAPCSLAFLPQSGLRLIEPHSRVPLYLE